MRPPVRRSDRGEPHQHAPERGAVHVGHLPAGDPVVVAPLAVGVGLRRARQREAGLPGFVSNEWTAIFAPAGTPREIVTRVNAAVSAALRTPEAIAKLKAIGADATTGSPAELDALLRDDLARWTKLAQTVKFEVQ